jgi:hypothetical protein
MKSDGFFCNIVVPFLITFIATGCVAQVSESPDLSDISVDRFQAEPFRLRDGQRITCWIRNTAWRSLGAVEAELEVTDSSGQSKTYPLASLSRVPAGRVVEIRKKVRGVSEPRTYRLIFHGTGAAGANERTVDVEPTGEDTVPDPLQRPRNDQSTSDARDTGYPRELDLGLSTSFSNGNSVEVGHLTVWKTDEQGVEVQGGIRNGVDSALKQTTITFSLTDSSGETTERSFTIDKRIHPGQIHPFSQSFSGIKELEKLGYRISYQPVSSDEPVASMSWEDVRNQLSPPAGTSSSPNSGDHSRDYPLLSLRGVKTISGQLNGGKKTVELYLLKVQMMYRSSAVRPTGKIDFEVLQNGTVQLSDSYPLRPGAYKPFPESPRVTDLQPGEAYWNADAKELYVVLFATSGIRTPSALRVRFTIRDAGTWTFDRLETPYMNSLIPPDRARK